jgi:DMSO/TMAO reductase YedYZ molybdopterin-dependent catalytic subunit
MSKPVPQTLADSAATDRRRFLMGAAAAAGALVMGGRYVLRGGDDAKTQVARAQKLPDGRGRLPPAQRLIAELRPMGGIPGDPNPAAFRLRLHGAVKREQEIPFAELLAMEQVDQTCDVHCVTGWSVLDSHWTGVRVADLAERAGVRSEARFVIFESAGGYTANIPLKDALKPTVLVAYRLEGDPLPLPNGPPARALVPHLYFWKSAKWLTGIRFQEVDEPGYWETRGYHNHGDPWKEERYG